MAFSFRPMLFSMGVVPQSNQNLTTHIMHSDQRKNFSHLELIILYHIISNLSITFQQFIHTGDTAQKCTVSPEQLKISRSW